MKLGNRPATVGLLGPRGQDAFQPRIFEPVTPAAMVPMQPNRTTETGSAIAAISLAAAETNPITASVSRRHDRGEEPPETGSKEVGACALFGSRHRRVARVWLDGMACHLPKAEVPG